MTGRGGRKLRLTIVYDTDPQLPELRGEFGFACLVQGLEKTILFDTGSAGETLLANLTALKVKPDHIDYVVISHSHYDHVGGLMELVRVAPHLTVFMPVSLPGSIKTNLLLSGIRIVEIKDAGRICEGAISTGEVGGSVPEQALILRYAKGFVVLTGCAHPGILQFAGMVENLAGGPVTALVGGFHLRDSARMEIQKVVARLRAMGIEKVLPTHCTGELARSMLAEAFGPGYEKGGVGAELELPL